MTSVLTGLSQITRSSGAFIAVGTGNVNYARFYSEAEFATAAALAGTAAGTNLYFATNALAITAFVTPTSDPASALVQFQLFKDLGKNYFVYVPQDATSGSVMGIWCVFTKVRRCGAPVGLEYEGDNGSVGYICTFSAAQTNANGALTTTEPRCIVARTGFGHAF
jgi:hypothetical protein